MLSNLPETFGNQRLRRLRHSEGIRALVRQVSLHKDDFIFPLFITHGSNKKTEIDSMPGQYQFSVDRLGEEIAEIVALGIGSVLLFGLPESKDANGSGAYAKDGIVQQAIAEIKTVAPELVVIADTCLCEYTDHGHCGIVNHTTPTAPSDLPEGYVLNDETLKALGETAVSQAQAGADIVAPSAMMDNMVTAIRADLDDNGFEHVAIMSYSVKYASAFYGPFRDAADGAPKFGDRKTHQMDHTNIGQAFSEAESDINQGADFLMVKPALSYLDIISQISTKHPQMPLVAYNVSGEYAMVKAAANKGWVNEKAVILEQLVAIKRAGASCIISYHAKQACSWL